MDISPISGSISEELKELVRTAHDLGIRIILDYVANHVHEEHPYFTEHRSDDN